MLETSLKITIKYIKTASQVCQHWQICSWSIKRQWSNQNTSIMQPWQALGN